eukprot:CAMPEP_0197041632 /NCGR_PEP_ID=MMETSP1384-20130603/18160_1 /TAXON_ID=29189 /ORGANISM="Ammonia sp." /LENGTH=241 /DNA_ID=CAMNT_0042472601 /DNA_START=104 /DNA_END=829 /DNA_ORIENTATION=-
MLYTIFSLFAFYELSAGSRLLLQVNPEYVPIEPATPAIPATPTEPGVPAQPAVPAEPAVPAIPTEPAVPAVTIPATPTEPAQPVTPGLPSFTLPPLPDLVPAEVECVLAYNEVGSCAGQIKTIENPPYNFKFTCSAMGSCAQSEIILDYAPGGFTDRIEGVWFTESFAGYQSTVVIRNRQGGNVVNVERLECQGATSCEGLTIILENAALNDLDCAYPSYCNQCFIKEGPLDPFPKPCYGY